MIKDNESVLSGLVKLEGKELSELLAKEDAYIEELMKRWKTDEISDKAIHYLRMGKRMELLGDLQFAKQQADVELLTRARRSPSNERGT